VFLFGAGHLLTGLADQLLALLTGLFTQLSHLALGLLADRLAVDQLLPLLTGLVDDLLGLLACLSNELLLLADQLLSLGQLRRQGIPHRIHQFDRILLIHEPTAAEGHPGAIEHDLLQLVQLIQNGGELRLGHQA
jgi:hypothetical protein